MEQAERERRLYFPKDGQGIPREKRFLDEQEGLPLQDVWEDVPHLAGVNAEGLGYPTQKPLAIGDLLNGKTIEMPSSWGTFKQAERATPADQPQTVNMFDT